MKIILKWTLDKANEPIRACCIDQVGKTIILIDYQTGKELKKIEKHTEEITSLSFRKDGLWFASGGKDKVVFFWDCSDLSKPLNKITLKEQIISVAYNPTSLTLLCISKNQACLYKDTEKTNSKIKLNFNATCCCWTNDGLRCAIGYENGNISLRDKENDKEIKNIILNGKEQERIWCISFSATKFKNKDYLMLVGTWEKNLFLIDISNYSIIEIKKLAYDPICLSSFKEDYFLIGTNNNEVNFYTKEGTYICNINENIHDWSLNIKTNSRNDTAVVTTNDGKVMLYGISFSIVHALHQDNYVSRQNLMDVCIQNLTTNKKMKIKCKRYIKKIAVFKDNLAVLANDRICIYKFTDEETSKLPKYIIKWEMECNLILVSTNHFVVCSENRLLLYTQSNNSVLEREWSFDSTIKYIKVIGGAPKREILIGGLRNGEVYMIYIDNQFPVLLYSHDVSIRSLDVSSSRRKLSIVDDNFDLLVLDIPSKTIVFKDEKAKAAAFNIDIEELICYCYDGTVFVKTSAFPSISEKISGVVVGFKGTKVFLLQASNSITNIDISHSNSIIRYTEKKDYNEAYKVACLGATKQELTFLGFEALSSFDLVVAVNCFIKLGDIRYINLVFKIENDLKDKVNKDIILAEILSYQGKYTEAAQCYIKGNMPEKAAEMYSTLKKWAEAIEIIKKFLNRKDFPTLTDSLLSSQAEWLMETGKFKEAGDLYMMLGKTKKAIEVYGQKGFLENLIEICRNLNKVESGDLIKLCGEYFKKNTNHAYAKEAYLKLGDIKSLMQLHIELQKWDEAFLLAKQNEQLTEYINLEYAKFLLNDDKFEDAQQAYKRAGRVDLSMKLLGKLIDNAVSEKRFKDVAYYFYCLSLDSLKLVKKYDQPQKGDYKAYKDHKDFQVMGDLYYSYDIIFKYIEEPFSNDLIHVGNFGLFNACKFIVNRLSNFNSSHKLKGLSLSYIYFALAFLSKQLEAYKTARFSFEKLNTLIIPQTWQDKIDYEIICVRSRPYLDKDNLMPLCYRCLNNNPLLNSKGDVCTTCGGEFIRSPLSNEILPLVEFKPKSGIAVDEAIVLLKSFKKGNKHKKLFTENAGKNSLVIHNNNANDREEELFGMKLVEWCETQISNEDYGVFEIDEEVLTNLNESEVFIVDLRNICPSYTVKFYKNRMHDISITMCKTCNKFFHTEEYENNYLKNNFCPYCKS